MDALDLTRVLAVGGFLPLVVLLAMQVLERRPIEAFHLRGAIASGDPVRIRRAGEQLIFMGMIIGIGPDVFVLLDNTLTDALLTFDRALDALAAPLLVLGVILLRGSKSINPKFGLMIWGGAILVCTLGGLAVVLV